MNIQIDAHHILSCHTVRVCVCQVLSACSAASPLLLNSTMTDAGSLLFTTALPETIMLAPAYKTLITWQSHDSHTVLECIANTLACAAMSIVLEETPPSTSISSAGYRFLRELTCVPPINVDQQQAPPSPTPSLYTLPPHMP